MNSRSGESKQDPDTMRVSRLHGIHDIRLEDLPRPQPGPGEVLLKVASVGVCGSDVHYYEEGRIGDAVVTAPIIMGHEFSAWIAGLGAGVEGLEIGQLAAIEPAIHCGECESFREEITGLIGELGNLVQLPDAKERRKKYNKSIDNMVKHLQKVHKLVSESHYKGIGMLIGGGISTALGAALDKAAIGPALGIGIGLAIGAYLDKKAREEGKVI